MNEHILVSEEDGVLEICFSRPDKKNAITNDMYREIREALETAHWNNAVRVIFFSAHGDAFTAGNDLGDFAKISNGFDSESHAQSFIEALCRAEKPIVAAVPGIAVGVGTTMLLHCDLVYVAETAKLSAPFVNLALVPEAASSMLMPARIGYVRSFAMFALGESITGTEAVALGLANKALPKDEVTNVARMVARTLSKKPAESIMASKRLMRDAETLLARMHNESIIFGERLKSVEAREVFKAFSERMSHG